MNRLDWLSWAAVAALYLALVALIASAQDPYQGVAPHDVPHCSPKGGKQSAPCRCLGMVGDVQAAKTAQCWEGAGVLIARDADGHPIETLLPDLTPEVSQCMAKVPDHCEVVAKAPPYWGYKGKNTCRTSCKPERCGCADEACRAHGSGVYREQP